MGTGYRLHRRRRLADYAHPARASRSLTTVTKHVRPLPRELIEPLRVKPGSKISLPGDFDPGHTASFLTEDAAAADLQSSIAQLAEFQARLAAQDTFGLLVVLQAMDAAGKDGTIKHVMTGLNPASVEVHGFKVPSAVELNHDYLHRYAQALPQRGQIGIFNRSHYEEVLVVRVHPDNLDRQHMPAAAKGKDVWKRRFREINGWERYLVENGIHVVKLFLNISKDEQRQRFLDRINHPKKNWKFSAADVAERHSWDAYQAAYSEVLSNTSTEWAPWYVIPADHKWFARLAAAAVIVDALARIDPRYPTISKAQRDALAKSKHELLAET